MKNKNCNKFKIPKLNMPSDYPRPWEELKEGDFIIGNYYILRWKTFHRHTKMKIYGYSKGHYNRVYWGRKVLHFKFKIRKITNQRKIELEKENNK